jgi:hypothetical protein
MPRTDKSEVIRNESKLSHATQMQPRLSAPGGTPPIGAQTRAIEGLPSSQSPPAGAALRAASRVNHCASSSTTPEPRIPVPTIRTRNVFVRCSWRWSGRGDKCRRHNAHNSQETLEFMCLLHCYLCNSRNFGKTFKSPLCMPQFFPERHHAKVAKSLEITLGTACQHRPGSPGRFG